MHYRSSPERALLSLALPLVASTPLHHYRYHHQPTCVAKDEDEERRGRERESPRETDRRFAECSIYVYAEVTFARLNERYLSHFFAFNAVYSDEGLGLEENSRYFSFNDKLGIL